MLITSAPVTDNDGTTKAIEAALDALDFLRRHGAGLCDLLGLLAEETAFDALCDLHGQSGSDLPDVRRVWRSLRSIRAALAARSTHANDALSVRKGYCVDTSVRWYGARISDLLAAFR